MKRSWKALCAVLTAVFLVSTFTLFLAGANPGPAAPETVTDELDDWSRVFAKSAGWQIDQTQQGLTSFASKNGNNDVQYLIYKTEPGIKNVRIYGYQLDVMSDVAQDVKAYVSDRGDGGWTPVSLTAGEPEPTANARWSSVTLSADNIPESPAYLKVEMGVLNIDVVGNCWVTGIDKVEIDPASPDPASPDPASPDPASPDPAEDLSDDLDNWSRVFDKSGGWQLDGTMPELGGVVNKAGNNETQHLIYALKGVRSVRIDTVLLSSSPELVNFVHAAVSENRESWREIPLEKGAVTASGREGWSTCTLWADEVGGSSQTQYLKIEIRPLSYANGADPVANCYGIGLARIEANKAVPSEPGQSDPGQSEPGQSEPPKPEEPELSDELDNFDHVYEKSDGWQLDASDKDLGGVINKSGNNDVQYITYKLEDIRDFVIHACQFSSMSDAARDIKAYVSADNQNWREVPLAAGDARFAGNWKIIALSASGVSGAKYLKVELGELEIDNVANCFVTGIAKVEINVPENGGEDDGASSVHDDLDDWSRVFDKSGGWQLDATDPALGTVINKLGNNDVQYITYKLKGIGSFSFTACSFSALSDVKKDFKAYVSPDNKTWKEVPLTAVKGKTTGSWTTYSLRAENIADGMQYLKIELQVLGIDEVANCFVTGIDRVDVYASKTLGGSPATGEIPAVFRLLPLAGVAAAAAAVAWKKRPSHTR